MNSRLRTLLLKELIQFSRDPVIIGMILYFYTLCVVICAYSLTFDIERLPMTIIDRDQSPASRAFSDKFRVSDALNVIEPPASETEAEAWLKQGKIQLVLLIPPKFQRDLMAGRQVPLQMLLDGANSNTADFARGYVAQIVRLFEQQTLPPQLLGREVIRPTIQFWYNPSQSFAPFMVLSMIAANALMVAIIHPAAGFVREKEVGTIQQLMVTPITTGELFVAKTLPTLGIGLISVFPSMLIAAAFDVPLRGSLPLFLILTAIFLLSAIALGVAVATVAKTLQQALLLAFFGLFPLMFLSGSLVPVESMPLVLQRISLLSPLRHYMDVILGIFLKGAGITELWPQATALLGIGIVLYSGALAIFRRMLA